MQDLATLSLLLRMMLFPKFFDYVVVDTGRHYDYDMNRVFYDQLEISKPHYFLVLVVVLMIIRSSRSLRVRRRFYLGRSQVLS